jgi:glucosamine--fructose-6-phosphate aminotransferase (isomerizing)
METKGQFTKEEIFSQVNAWAGAIREVKNKKEELSKFDVSQFDQIIFTGCGSTYYLSISAARIFQSMTGKICKAVPGGEMLLNPDTVYQGKKNLLFAISRSGSTSETVKAVENFKEAEGGRVICVTNYPDQPLPALADLVIAITEGQERSVAQTRSFSSMFVAITATALMMSGKEMLLTEMEKLPDIGTSLINKYQEFARKIGENVEFDRFYFLGNGFRFGLASEANLKMKEMTLTHTEPFHFLEFRHGPKSMVTENTCVVGLLSESNREYEQKVLDEMKAIGATIMTIAEKDADISFESGLSQNVQGILYLPLLQIMAFYRSIKKGLDPDNPKNLTTVVYLD